MDYLQGPKYTSGASITKQSNFHYKVPEVLVCIVWVVKKHERNFSSAYIFRSTYFFNTMISCYGNKILIFTGATQISQFFLILF